MDIKFYSFLSAIYMRMCLKKSNSLILKNSFAIHFVDSRFTFFFSPYHSIVSIVVCVETQTHIRWKCSMLNNMSFLILFIVFSCQNHLTFLERWSFGNFFKNKIVQIPLYSFRKIQTLSAAEVHEFFYLFLFIFGMEWKGFQCSLRFLWLAVKYPQK